MPSTYTDILRLIDQANGENDSTWGDLTDTNFALVEEAIGGTQTISVTTGSDITLSSNNGASDQSRKAVLKLTGTPSTSINIIVPSSSKLYVIEASGVTWGANTITVKTAGGTGVDFKSTATAGFVYCDGTDVIGIVDLDELLQAANNLSDLENVATARTNLGLGALAVEDSVTTGVIDDDAVTSAKIADGTIVNGNIADATITSDKMTTTGITAGDYDLASITVDVAGRITAVQSGSVDGGTTPGNGTVGQNQLKTSTSTTTVTNPGKDYEFSDGHGYILNGKGSQTQKYVWGKRVSLTGGQYGFTPQLTLNITSSFPYAMQGTIAPVPYTETNSVVGGYDSFLIEVGEYLSNVDGVRTRVSATARQRYVTASTPYNLGDGDVYGFLFLLLGPNNEVQGLQFADTPPWVYNGPTSVTPDRVDYKTGKKYKLIPKNLTKEAILNGEPPVFEEVEIGHDIKNADMNLIPHPFGTISDDQKVVLVDPMDPDIERLLQWQEQGVDIFDLITKDNYLKIDRAEKINRKTPDGILPVSLVKR